MERDSGDRTNNAFCGHGTSGGCGAEHQKHMQNLCGQCCQGCIVREAQWR